MYPVVQLYSNTDGAIFDFLSRFYDKNHMPEIYQNTLEWEHSFENPVEMVTLLGVFLDNIDDYDIVMWISLDKGMLVKITPNNADSIIRYLYERFPY